MKGNEGKEKYEDFAERKRERKERKGKKRRNGLWTRLALQLGPLDLWPSGGPFFSGHIRKIRGRKLRSKSYFNSFGIELWIRIVK
ncbi:hypothetical protein SLE2022_354130 [Rubroshorea leprosula]